MYSSEDRRYFSSEDNHEILKIRDADLQRMGGKRGYWLVENPEHGDVVSRIRSEFMDILSVLCHRNQEVVVGAQPSWEGVEVAIQECEQQFPKYKTQIYLLSLYNYDQLDKGRIRACTPHVISNSVLKCFSRVVRLSTPGLSFGVSVLYDDSSSKVGEMRGLTYIVYIWYVCSLPISSILHGNKRILIGTLVDKMGSIVAPASGLLNP